MMEFFKSIFILYCAVYATRWVAIKIIIWFRLRRLARPYYGPTINDHERRLRKEIGQFSEQHATLARPSGSSGDINKSHWTNDSSYSGLPGNVFHIGKNDEINPGSGLPMSGGFSDVSGNPWGYDD